MARNQKGISALIGILLIVVIGALIAVGWFVWQKDKDQQKLTTTTNNSPNPAPAGAGAKASFATPKKGAHFETSTPAHASTLAAVPVDVVIDFNFDLASNSTIKIEKDGKDYGTGTTAVDNNKLAMRRKMDSNAPDGIYTVNYKGCWPDRTCHDGSFQFAIDKGRLDSYQDMRNQKTITVKMSAIKFQPMNIQISPGTTISWVNDDNVEHYVNTDSHPAHSHVPGLNSRALAKGATYSFTFEKAGAYPYHCSAHAANMIGNIVVG